MYIYIEGERCMSMWKYTELASGLGVTLHTQCWDPGDCSLAARPTWWKQLRNLLDVCQGGQSRLILFVPCFPTLHLPGVAPVISKLTPAASSPLQAEVLSYELAQTKPRPGALSGHRYPRAEDLALRRLRSAQGSSRRFQGRGRHIL